MAIKDRLPSTEALLESLPLPRDFLTRLGVLAGTTTRQLSINTVGISSASLSNVEIGKVNLGNASIGDISISNTRATLEQSSAFLRNVRCILELGFVLDWEIDLGWIGHWRDSSDLGSLDIPVDLGDIHIPDLDNIELAIPQVNIPDVIATMKPVTNLQLGTFSLSGAEIEKLALPAAGLSVTGLGIGDVSISSLAVPGANANTVSVAQAKPERDVALPGATLQNLRIPRTSVPSIASGRFDTTATASAQSLTVNLGILKITLRVTPTVHLDVGAMSITDALLSATLGDVSINDIRLPVSVDSISAGVFEANGVSVNQIRF